MYIWLKPGYLLPDTLSIIAEGYAESTLITTENVQQWYPGLGDDCANI